MLHDFAVDVFEGERLHRELSAMRERNPVSRALFAGQPAMVITGHQALAEAFRDNDCFPPADAYRITIEPVQGVTFQTMEDEQHRLYRRLATPAFRSSAVDAMEQEGLARIATNSWIAWMARGRPIWRHPSRTASPFW